MGHGWRNYFVVAIKDLGGIERFWGLDKQFPSLGKRYVARVLCGSRRIFVSAPTPRCLRFGNMTPVSYFGWPSSTRV